MICAGTDSFPVNKRERKRRGTAVDAVNAAARGRGVRDPNLGEEEEEHR